MRFRLWVPLTCLLLTPMRAPGQSTPPDGRQDFSLRCAACHGADGRGGERAPSLRTAAARGAEDLRRIIEHGLPERGMPAFPLSAPQLDRLVAFVRLLAVPASDAPVEGDAANGRALFAGSAGCTSCHMVNGRGGLLGPDLSFIGKERSRAELEQSIRVPQAHVARGFRALRVKLRDGRVMEGLVKNDSGFDLQLQEKGGTLRLLRREDVINREELPSFMPKPALSEPQLRDLLSYVSRLDGSGLRAPVAEPVPVPASAFAAIAKPAAGDWPTYNGHLHGNRHSELAQITTQNVKGLAPRWMFPMRELRRLQVTPVVMSGVMYVTAVNQVYALDSATGRELWHYRREATKGLAGDAASGINRGVAVLGDRLFLATDHAHLLALNRINGALLWEAEIADHRQNYGATSAPLVVEDLVIMGTSGGDEGASGLIAAFSATNGRKVWEVHTIPQEGEPGADTWQGSARPHGCATTWLTGTYDPALGLLYWTTGNPCPDYNGDERRGDNLYSNSVLALDPRTGTRRWHFQFTPHDLHDWDSVQTPMLADMEYRGRPRQVLLQANRNGFFYVLDRRTGEFLHGTPFARQTWAKELTPQGRPVRLSGIDPTPAGVKVCPAVEGATNWMSAAYHPGTALYYVMAMDKCSIFTKAPAVWKAGESYYGGDTRDVPEEPGRKFLRALDPQTGKLAWEVPQIGPGNTWGGVLSTAGGLVFYGDDSGALAAVDARSGAPLWHFHTNQQWKASPMTYTAGGKQFIAIASGNQVIAFALP